MTNNNQGYKETRWSVWWAPLIGFIGVIAGVWINHIDHSGDVDAKMVELTVGVLRTKPEPETMPLRDWAIRTLQQRAHFSFTEKQITVLKNQKLPYDFEPYGHTD